jgi:hypothetical protein
VLLLPDSAAAGVPERALGALVLGQVAGHAAAEQEQQAGAEQEAERA